MVVNHSARHNFTFSDLMASEVVLLLDGSYHLFDFFAVQQVH